jgi:hypothetical protein
MTGQRGRCLKKSFSDLPIYEKTQSGVILQTGRTSEATQEGSQTYGALKQKALDLRAMYVEHGLSVHPASDLASLMAKTITLSDALLCADDANLGFDNLICSVQLARFADAALSLRDAPNPRKYLSELLDGSTDLFARTRSKAKDTLWELELWQMLQRVGINATLEEPDIVANFEGKLVGIACKKLYSENNAERVVSDAVRQFEKQFDFGMIALNVDDLIPEGKFLQARTKPEAANILTDFCGAFAERNDRYLRKYLGSGRAICAIISVSTLVDASQSTPRFNNMRQSVFWTIPGLPVEKEKQVENFFNVYREFHS